MTVTNKFNKYMVDIQNKRYQRIVSYFEEAYKRDGSWKSTTGIELMHEAYMGNYCLSVMDANKQLIWGMNPSDLKNQIIMEAMPTKNNGVYTTKTFAINVNKKIVGYVDIGQYSSVLMTEEDKTFKTSINKSIVASGILTLIIISSLSFYFSKQFSNPIKEVARLSVSLSKGDFNAKSRLKSNIKELEDLRNSVNVLASKLKYQDVLRSRLVSDLSHEIRTPLNVLQNNLEAMIDGIYPVTTEKLQYLNKEVIRFGKLVNNLNVLKEFESESTRLNYEIIFLDEIIVDIYKEFSSAARKKNIKMDYEIQPNNKYRINGDKDKIRQVFINLLSNALKFTAINGTVQIKLFETKENIIVEIIDNGIGINEKDLPFIFERLYRGDKSRHQIDGNGLGLTIAKNILQLHNASIKAESQEGAGTKFTVCFSKMNILKKETKEL